MKKQILLGAIFGSLTLTSNTHAMADNPIHTATTTFMLASQIKILLDLKNQNQLFGSTVMNPRALSLSVMGQVIPLLRLATDYHPCSLPIIKIYMILISM